MMLQNQLSSTLVDMIAIACLLIFFYIDRKNYDFGLFFFSVFFIRPPVNFLCCLFPLVISMSLSHKDIYIYIRWKKKKIVIDIARVKKCFSYRDETKLKGK